MQPPEWARGSTAGSSAPAAPGADDFASGVFPSPLGLVDATAIMMKTNTFAVNIGDAYAPPRHVHAFNVILDSPSAREIFESVFRSGTSAGKLYALAAFSLLDQNRYQQAAAELGQELGGVRTIDGCLYDDQPVANLVKKIAEEHLGETFRRRRAAAYVHFDGAG